MYMKFINLSRNIGKDWTHLNQVKLNGFRLKLSQKYEMNLTLICLNMRANLFVFTEENCIFDRMYEVWELDLFTLSTVRETYLLALIRT